eukprot:14474.XXX_519810_520043_1 [CDS] Oithona nana genome sequencing.
MKFFTIFLPWLPESPKNSGGVDALSIPYSPIRIFLSLSVKVIFSRISKKIQSSRIFTNCSCRFVYKILSVLSIKCYT